MVGGPRKEVDILTTQNPLEAAADLLESNFFGNQKVAKKRIKSHSFFFQDLKVTELL